MSAYDNIRVRFSWQYDLDLIGLSCVEGFSVALWIKKAVVAYARGDGSFIVPVPESPVFIEKNKAGDCDFALNKETEADVIAVLSGFRTGFRNSAIKQIFRAFLSRPFLEAYFHDCPINVPTRRKQRKNWEYVDDNKGEKKAVPLGETKDPTPDVAMPPFPLRSHSFQEDNPSAEDMLNRVVSKPDESLKVFNPEVRDFPNTQTGGSPAPKKKKKKKSVEGVQNHEETDKPSFAKDQDKASAEEMPATAPPVKGPEPTHSPAAGSSSEDIYEKLGELF